MKTKTNYRRAAIQNRQSKIHNSKADSDLAKKVALSCQILAKLGQFKETTGHVSARSANGSAMWIRGRGKEESGLLFTKASEVVLADFNGQKLNPKIVLKTPNESVIHVGFSHPRVADWCDPDRNIAWNLVRGFFARPSFRALAPSTDPGVAPYMLNHMRVTPRGVPG